AALLIVGLRPQTPFVPVAGERASLWADMRTGLRWLAKHRLLRLLAVLLGLVNMAHMFAVLDVLPGLFPNVAVVVVAGTLMSVFGTTWNVITVSLRQRLIPPELFGRVNSVYRFLGTGSTSIGAVIGGQLAYRYGLRATYLVSGALLLTALVVAAPTLLRYGRIYMAPERTPAPPSIT
ncbi:MAG: hypothetical protein EBW27_07570, partial [Acidimicrobiia bacterium]|nr:hypothetical protein [Acidimicrobiia bacterium]